MLHSSCFISYSPGALPQIAGQVREWPVPTPNFARDPVRDELFEAERVSIDSRMPRDQWLRFTDFGVTIQDKTGRHIDALPLNYAFGRHGGRRRS